MKNRQPVFVKIIAVVIMISALWLMFSLVLNFTLSITSGGLTSELSAEELEIFKLRFASHGWEFNENNVLLIFVLGLIIGLAFGIFELIVGIKVWQGRNWARITAIVFGFIIAFGSLISVLTGNYWKLFEFVIALAIAVYLLVSVEAKKYFKKKR